MSARAKFAGVAANFGVTDGRVLLEGVTALCFVYAQVCRVVVVSYLDSLP